MNNLEIETIDWEYENELLDSDYDIPNLEEAVLSCLLQDDTLMNYLIVSEKDFHEYSKTFKYMKQFYEKFHCFDLTLMTIKNDFKERSQFIDTFVKLKCYETAISNFKLYQEALLEYNKQYALEIEKEQIQKELQEKMVLLEEKKISLEQYFDEIEKIKERWNDYDNSN